jgi:three-Cys-motif partner protein
MTTGGQADPYRGREQTEIKHFILRRYMEKLAYKVGTWCATLNYVEGFAGPWRSRDESLADTSPHIALKELDKARDGLHKIGKTPRIRCLFVEEDPPAAEALRASIRNPSNSTVMVGRFLDVIPRVVAWIQAPDCRDPRFTFLFVDPTGWTGYDPDAIAPVLRAGNAEVLINFMTKDIIRFIDSGDEPTHRSFVRLFGSEEAWEEWQGLTGREREDAIVHAFCRRLGEVGNFEHVVAAAILNPLRDRTHFHLVYGTRHDEGLRTFREVERKALNTQTVTRERARQHRRIELSGQGELFAAGEIESPTYEQELLEHYQETARAAMRDRLRSAGRMRYEDVEVFALLHPMTAPEDVKLWLQEWRSRALLRYTGMGPRERSLKAEAGHVIVWTGGDAEGG